MSIYDELIAEFHHRKCAHADIYPGHYACSVGAHMFNLVNQETEVLIANAIPIDTRLHIMMVAPPGYSKTFWLEMFLRGKWCMLEGTTIQHGFEGSTCLPAGTLIQLSDGSLKPIETISVGDSVLSLNNEWKLTPEKVLVTSNQLADTMTLRLKGGYELCSTRNHPLLTINGWVEAGALNVGDEVAVPYKINIQSTVDYDDRLVALLGYFIADGTFDQCNFYETNKDIVANITEICTSMEFTVKQTSHNPKIEYHIGDKGSGYPHRLIKWFNSVFHTTDLRGELRNHKYIPDDVFRLSKSKIAIFLRYLFSGNGYANERIIQLCGSRATIIGTRDLLKRFGILANVNHRDEKTSVLQINSQDDIERFIEEIGFIGKHANQGVVERSRSGGLKAFPVALWDIIEQEKGDIPWYKLSSRCGYAIEQARYQGLRIRSDTLRAIADETHSEKLQTLVDGDVIFLPIIDTYDVGEQRVYNLTVSIPNYIADGIITHNTEAGFVGSASMSEGGDPVVTPGLAKIYEKGIVGFEEFSALTAMMKSSHSQQLDAAMLLALDRGYVVKRLRAGRIGYKTNVTVFAGTQPARFDLTSGLGRRFYYLLLIPTADDKELIRGKIREGWGVRMNLDRTNKIRAKIDEVQEELYKIKSVRRTPAVNNLLDELRMPPYEEQLYIRLIIGYKVITQDFGSELTLDLDPRIAALCKQEAIWRKAIRRGPEIAEVVALLRHNGNQMSIVELRDELMDFGIDWKKSSELIAELSKMKILVLGESNVTLKGKWE